MKTNFPRITLFVICIASCVSNLWADTPAYSAASELASNYKKISKNLATSGSISKNTGALKNLKTLGIDLIIDLRTANEGNEKEAISTREHGLNYLNLPIGKELPDAKTVSQFSQALKQHGDDDILVHCRSGNRAGLLWAMHRISEGLDTGIAIKEGQEIGMSWSRTRQLKASLQYD